MVTQLMDDNILIHNAKNTLHNVKTQPTNQKINNTHCVLMKCVVATPYSHSACHVDTKSKTCFCYNMAPVDI